MSSFAFVYASSSNSSNHECNHEYDAASTCATTTSAASIINELTSKCSKRTTDEKRRQRRLASICFFSRFKTPIFSILLILTLFNFFLLSVSGFVFSQQKICDTKTDRCEDYLNGVLTIRNGEASWWLLEWKIINNIVIIWDDYRALIYCILRKA